MVIKLANDVYHRDKIQLEGVGRYRDVPAMIGFKDFTTGHES